MSDEGGDTTLDTEKKSAEEVTGNPPPPSPEKTDSSPPATNPTTTSSSSSSSTNSSSDDYLRNLIVNYLPNTLDESGLRQIFEVLGDLELVKVVYDRRTQQSKGYGFVKYKEAADAEAAIENLNGHRVGNKRLKVAYAQPENPNCYVTGFPSNCTREQLEDTFADYGDVVEIKMLKPRLPVYSTGIAFVKFGTQKEAMTSVDSANKKETDLGTLNVKLAKRRQPKKTKTPNTNQQQQQHKTSTPNAGQHKHRQKHNAHNLSSKLNPALPNNAIDPTGTVPIDGMNPTMQYPPPPPVPQGPLVGGQPTVLDPYSQYNNPYLQQQQYYPQPQYQYPTVYSPYMWQPPYAYSSVVPSPNAQTGYYTLFVYNLPPWADETLLWSLFGKYGAIVNATVVKDKTARCKGYGFVHYVNYADGLAAIQQMNGHVLNGKQLQVSFKKNGKGS